MGLLSLILGGPDRVRFDLTQVIQSEEGDVSGLLQMIELDATISEQHSSSAEPTEHPIEDGSTIADHIQVKPDSLSIEGMISDTPLTFGASLTGLASAGGIALGSKAAGGLGFKGASQIGGAVGGVLAGSIAGLLAGEGEPRSKNHFEFLRELQKRRLRFNIVTGLITYTNMVLTELSVPRDVTTGKSLRFSATMREIQIVESAVIFLPEVSILKETAASASTTNKAARKTATEAEGATAGKSKTVLEGLFGGDLGGLLKGGPP